MRIGPRCEGEACFIETVCIKALANISETVNYSRHLFSSKKHEPTGDETELKVSVLSCLRQRL